MNLGKCPVCQEVVERAIIEILHPDLNQSKLVDGGPKGLSFVCPNPKCHTILGVIELK